MEWDATVYGRTREELGERAAEYRRAECRHPEPLAGVFELRPCDDQPGRNRRDGKCGGAERHRSHGPSRTEPHPGCEYPGQRHGREVVGPHCQCRGHYVERPANQAGSLDCPPQEQRRCGRQHGRRAVHPGEAREHHRRRCQGRKQRGPDPGAVAAGPPRQGGEKRDQSDPRQRGHEPQGHGSAKATERSQTQHVEDRNHEPLYEVEEWRRTVAADDVDHPIDRLVDDHGCEVFVQAEGLAGDEREPEQRGCRRDHGQHLAVRKAGRRRRGERREGGSGPPGSRRLQHVADRLSHGGPNDRRPLETQSCQTGLSSLGRRASMIVSGVLCAVATAGIVPRRPAW